MFNSFLNLLFPYQVEASLLICRASQWTGFYVIGASVMKELNFMQRAGLLLIITQFLPNIYNRIDSWAAGFVYSI